MANNPAIFNSAVVGFFAAYAFSRFVTSTDAIDYARLGSSAEDFANVLDNLIAPTTVSDALANAVQENVEGAFSSRYQTPVSSSEYSKIAQGIVTMLSAEDSLFIYIPPPSGSSPWTEDPPSPNGVIQPVDAGASVQGGGSVVSTGFERIFAWGDASTASGDDSVAFGGGVATALAFAFGTGASATGSNSAAFNEGEADTFNDFAVNIGRAVGGSSFAANFGLASGNGSSAFNQSQAEGFDSFAANTGVAVQQDGAAFNQSTASYIADFSANTATADGGNSAAFNNSNAGGNNAFACTGGVAALAFDFAATGALANGGAAAAFGNTGSAQGPNSFAVLGTVDATGENSIALGFNTFAYDYASVAIGGGTATYDYSIAIGPIVTEWTSGIAIGNDNCFVRIGDDPDNQILEFHAQAYQFDGGQLGFYGTTAINQPIGTAATAGAVYTGVEQGMLNDLFTMATSLGLLGV
jgi:Head domain of trimeric autotransporter adhesin